MKAAMLMGNQSIEIKEIAEPTPKANEVILKVGYTGICGTDLHEYQAGPMFAKANVVLGHETAGTVVASGNISNKFSNGSRVTVIPMDYCRHCHYCLHGLYHLCEQPGWVGFTRNGAFAPYVAVPEHLLVPLPDEVSLEVGALTEHFAVAFHAVRRARLQVGERILILGAGPLGLAVMQCALAAGASDVLVTETNKLRLETASSLGATQVYNPVGEGAEERVMQRTGGIGVDVVFDCAGTQKALELGFSCLRKRGRFIEMSAWGEVAKINTNNSLLAEHEIIFMFGYEMYDDFPAVLDLMARGVIDAGKQITKKISLDEIVKEGILPLVNGTGEEVKVLVDLAR